MTNSLPKISVIIPVLNAVKTIEKALLSVVQQNYDNLELIVLDAGSTDGTLDIIQQYSHAIHYWHSKPDGSTGHAINLGMQRSTGDLIAQLMADDWFELNTFHAIGNAYIKDPDADVISCGGRIMRFDLNKKQYVTTVVYNSIEKLTLNYENVCFGIPGMSSRFLAKSLIDKIGMMIAFDEQGKHLYSADRELLLRVATYHPKHIIIDHLGHTYLAHAASATFGNNKTIPLRILQEHMIMATTYLARQDLSHEQRVILKQWYADQSVRLFLHKMVGCDFKSALTIFLNGMKVTKLQWIKKLFSVSYKILKKKMV